MASVYGAQAILRDESILESWQERLRGNVSLDYLRHLALFSFSPSMADGLSVIEYGCGPVGGVLPLLDKALKRVGMDVLMEQYERTGLLKRPIGVHMLKGDMADAHWNGEFDVAFCVNTLDHAADEAVPEKALWAMYQALARGGRLYLHFHCRKPEQIDVKHLYAIDENWLLGTADVIGFKVGRMDIHPKDPLNFVNERAYKTIVAVLEK